MTTTQMAQELNISESNFSAWLKAVEMFVKDGQSVEEAVERVHGVFSYLASQMALPAGQRSRNMRRKMI